MESLGSFWSNVYQGQGLVSSVMESKGMDHDQVWQNMLELVGSISRYDTPVFHRENWHFLTLSESEMNTESVSVEKYDGSVEYGGSERYGLHGSGEVYIWKSPNDLKNVSVIMNRLTDPSCVLIDGVDYLVNDKYNGSISFRENPFKNSLHLTRDVFKEGVVVDREVGVWLFMGDFDWESVYRQWGYVLGLKLESSEQYREYVNVIIDAMIDGSSVSHLRSAMSLITGIPIARENKETVEGVVQSLEVSQVITDCHVYSFHPKSDISVSIGDVVSVGDTFTNDLMFFEFKNGESVDPSDLRSLSTGHEFMGYGYSSSIVWENKDLPLVVTEDVSGKTKVEWELAGWPGDAERMFSEIHHRGVQSGRTLANYLDIRDNPQLEPTAMSLPETINPFQFLVNNLFRKFVMVVKYNPSRCGDHRLSSHSHYVLRKIVPPESAMILKIEYSLGDKLNLTDQGNWLNTGNLVEHIKRFDGCRLSDPVDSSRVSGSARLFIVRGRCI